MAFLRIRRKVLRTAMLNPKGGETEQYEVADNGRLFTTRRARLEYERRSKIEDAGYRGFEEEHFDHYGGIIRRTKTAHGLGCGSFTGTPKSAKHGSVHKWEWKPGK